MPNAAYTQPFRFPATLDGAPLTVVSKAGLADGSTVGAAASLVATLVQPAATETVLLLGRCRPNAGYRANNPKVVVVMIVVPKR